MTPSRSHGVCGRDPQLAEVEKRAKEAAGAQMEKERLALQHQLDVLTRERDALRCGGKGCRGLKLQPLEHENPNTSISLDSSARSLRALEVYTASALPTPRTVSR